MKVAFCGAHRTGKTTLVDKLAFGVHQLVPVKTKTSQVFAENGMDPSAHYDFSQRLDIQFKILEALNKQYDEGGVSFITDRTPFDALTYTVCDINNSTEAFHAMRIHHYVELCKESMQRFDKIFLIQPQIDLVYEEGKASLNPAYIDHFNCVLIGLFVSHNIPFTLMPKSCYSVERRVKFVLENL